MIEIQGRKITFKLIGVLILAGIVMGTVLTLLQKAVLGRSIPAVTGGVIGAVTSVTLAYLWKKPKSS